MGEQPPREAGGNGIAVEVQARTVNDTTPRVQAQ